MIAGANSSRCSAVRQPRGRSRHARSRASGCGALVCSWGPSTRTIRSCRQLRRIFAKVAAIGLDERRNVQIDYRWGLGNADNVRNYTMELAAIAPDVILAHATPTVGPLLQVTRTVPIVFPVIVDPVGAGFVESLARPGGNATGFTTFEYGMSGKWLELLKQITPSLTRVAVLRDPELASGTGEFGAIQAVAPLLGVEVTPVNVRDAGEIERAVTAFLRSANGGLIVPASAAATSHRNLIITLAARHKLPAIYFDRAFVAIGGLSSYGSDQVDPYRLAAGYVDRILKGEKVGELPIQHRRSTSWCSTSRPPRRLGCKFPTRCSPGPTR